MSYRKNLLRFLAGHAIIKTNRPGRYRLIKVSVSPDIDMKGRYVLK